MFHRVLRNHIFEFFISFFHSFLLTMCYSRFRLVLTPLNMSLLFDKIFYFVLKSIYYCVVYQNSTNHFFFYRIAHSRICGIVRFPNENFGSWHLSTSIVLLVGLLYLPTRPLLRLMYCNVHDSHPGTTFHS